MRFRTRHVTIAASFAALAFLARFFNATIPIGGPFVLDVRGIFVAVGAAIGGPWVGLVVGLVSGIPAQIPLIDVPSFGAAGLATGFLAQRLGRFGVFISLSVLGMLVGYAVAAVVIYLFLPSILASIAILVLRAAVLIPLEFLILLALYRVYPRAFELNKADSA